MIERSRGYFFKGAVKTLLALAVMLHTGYAQTKTIQTYIFGHSLIDHQLGSEPAASNVPIWLNRLVRVAENEFQMDGQFGQLNYHTLPPTNTLRYDNITAPWQESFDASPYSSIILTPANFSQEAPPEEVLSYWDNDSWLNHTLRVVDHVLISHPDIVNYVYEAWPEPRNGALMGDSTYVVDNYFEAEQDHFHDWHVQLQDRLSEARPGKIFKLIPAGSIIAGIFKNVPEMLTIPFSEIYEDDAPHGLPPLYFLTSIIFYSVLYEEKAPENFIVPETMPQAIRDHYAEIIDYVWSALPGYVDANGSSRVFAGTVEQQASSSSQQSSSVVVSSISSESSTVTLSSSSFDMIALPNNRGSIANEGIYNIAINAGDVVDWASNWADMMRTSRLKDLTDVPLDDKGWPLTDFGVLVYQSNAPVMTGTYAMKFEGIADVSITGGDVSNVLYNAETNTTTLDWVVTRTDATDIIASFNNTNNGIKNAQLMRPIAEGSTEAYPFDQLLTNEFMELLEPFTTIRTMGMTQTNGSIDSLWEDHVSWDHATLNHFQSYVGGMFNASFEAVIKLANVTQKDVWICVPHKVTDNYVQNLALLFKEGSASVEPLDPNLNLYVEYSNEIWNWAAYFDQTGWVHDQAENYGHPLTFDGEDDSTTLMYRYKAMRSVQISEIFREVFGDDQMMSRVRPVIAWQKDWNDLVDRTISFVDRYYNAMDPRSDWTSPHPMNYYFYGGGGTGYWNHEGFEGTLTTENIWDAGEWNHETFAKNLYNDAAWARAHGLEYLAYEGDNHPHFDGDEVVYRAIHWDERMYQASIDHVNAFYQVGGGMFAFLGLAARGDEVIWSAYNLDTGLDGSPQYRAILDMAQSARPQITYGNVAPFETDGAAFDVFGLNTPKPNGTGSVTVTAQTRHYSVAYMYRVNESSLCELSIDYSTNEETNLYVEYDGFLLDQFTENTHGQTVTSPTLYYNCTSGALHGIRIYTDVGELSVHKIRMATSEGVGINPDTTTESSTDQSSSSTNTESSLTTESTTSSISSDDATAPITGSTTESSYGSIQTMLVRSTLKNVTLPQEATLIEVYTLMGQRISKSAPHDLSNSIHKAQYTGLLYLKIFFNK
ncbi:MAG: hypothetical protein OCD76_17805 [Reichenbachiella sp.]